MSQKDKGKPEDLLEKAADLLMGLFRVCASDRLVAVAVFFDSFVKNWNYHYWVLRSRSSPEDSKRKGMLILVNQLFKIYFKVCGPNFYTYYFVRIGDVAMGLTDHVCLRIVTAPAEAH